MSCPRCQLGNVLHNQVQAARHCGLGVKAFRAICRTGEGPAEFNPGSRSRTLFAPAVLDAWMAGRDDRNPKRGAA